MLSNFLENFLFTTKKTINIGIGGDRAKNVLQPIDDIVLPKYVILVVIHCIMNNIDTRKSDETSLGFVNIARCIAHRHPNIEVIVSELLPRHIYWSTQIVKIKKISACLKDYYNIFTKITFMSQDQDLTLPDNFLYHQSHHRNCHHHT